MQSNFGISEHIHPELKGFTGIIKYKYSDFIVRELCTDGTIISISSDLSALLEHETEKSIEQSNVTVDKGEELLQINLPKLLEQIYTSQGKDKISLLSLSIRQLFTPTNASTNKVILPPIDDKLDRKKLHEFFQNKDLVLLDESQRYYIAFQTTTIIPENQISISFDKLSSHTRKRKHETASLPQFIILYLLKRNKDTMEAIQRIASFFKIPDKSLSFSGTKDRRAITFQRISLRDPSRCFHGDTWNVVKDGIEKLNNAMNRHGISLFLPNTEQEYSIDHHLQLGELGGNQFDIIIRNIKMNQTIEKINEYMETLTKALMIDGFINYYGSQRFGHSHLVPTWKVGLAFLNKDWIKVIRLLLEPKDINIDQDVDSDLNQIEKARKLFWIDKNAHGAFSLLSRKWIAERSIISYYQDNPDLLDSFRNPLSAIERIPHELRMLYLHALQSYIWNHVASERIKLGRLKPILGDMIICEEPRILDQLNVDIDKIVMPLPGSSISEYPHRYLYEQVMKDKLGLGLDAFNSNENDKYNLQGDYRKLVVKPLDFQWKLFEYSSPDDIFQKFDGTVVSFSNTNGSCTGLKISCKLPSSSYATMMLEEIMKCNTCSEYQKNLDNLL